MSEIIVTMDHVYASGGCAPGARTVLKQHKLDYRKFFKEGLPISVLEVIDDHMIQHVVKEARRGR